MNFTIAQTANYQISRGRNRKDINVSIKRQDKTFGHQFILQEEYALINGHDHFLILYRCLDMGQFKDLYVEMKQKHLDCKAWKRFASLLDHTSSSLLIRNIPLEEKAFEIVSSSKGDCSKLFHIFPFYIFLCIFFYLYKQFTKLNLRKNEMALSRSVTF